MKFLTCSCHINSRAGTADYIKMQTNKKQYSYIQAGLILRLVYVPTKRRAKRTQNFHLKQCISWGYGD